MLPWRVVPARRDLICPYTKKHNAIRYLLVAVGGVMDEPERRNQSVEIDTSPRYGPNTFTTYVPRMIVCTRFYRDCAYQHSATCFSFLENED